MDEWMDSDDESSDSDEDKEKKNDSDGDSKKGKGKNKKGMYLDTNRNINEEFIIINILDLYVPAE